MASSFNAKCVHKDGRTELKIGVDENAKIINGDGKVIQFRNSDGTKAKIDKNNIIGMPENVSETNKLVTQEDLDKMLNKLSEAMKAQNESMQALIELSRIVGNIGEEN